MADVPGNDKPVWPEPRGVKSGKWEDAPAGAPSADEPPAGKPPAASPPLSDLIKPAISGVARPAAALWNDPRGKPLILFSVMGLIVVCGLSCFIFSLALLSSGPLVPGPGPTPQVTAAPAEPTRMPTPANPVKANDTPLPVVAPTKLTIRSASFAIEPLRLDRGQWVYDRNKQKTVFWASGTLINYVMGLHASNENKIVFDALAAGDLIVLDTSVGPQRFRVAELQQIRVDDDAPFRNQLAPQLTLVLLGESGNQRRIAVAKYTDEGTPNTLVSSGVPVNLGDAQVKVTDSRVVQGPAAGLAADRNLYQVNFHVTNLTTRTLSADQFTSQLIDAAGGKYAVSQPGSSAAGALGWARGVLAPSQTVSATAAFDVPASMPGGKLEWTFALETSTPYLARVSIPYRQLVVAPTPAPTQAPVAEVTVLGATLSPEGNELRVVGTVRNLTGNFVNVSQRDVSLTSGQTSNLLNTTLPAMPWSIPANETLAFQFSFSRPPGGQPAIFTLLGRSFEIGGL